MRLKNIYSKASIKYKILLFFWLIILLLAASLGIYSYRLSRNLVTERAYASSIETVRQINNNIQFAQKDFYDVLTLMSIDKQAQELLKDAQTIAGQSSENYAIWESERINSLQTIINLSLSKRYVSRIVLYSNVYDLPLSSIDKSTTIGLGNVKNLSKLRQSDEFSQIVSANCRIVWFALEPGETFFNTQLKDRQIIAAKLVKNLITQKPVGLLITASDDSLFRESYQSLLPNSENKVAIFDREGGLISCSDNAFYEALVHDEKLMNNVRQENISKLIKSPEGTQLITSCSDNDAGWIIVYAVPYSSVIGEITNIKWFTVAIIIISLLLSIPITMLIFHPISKSINQLLESMNRFKTGDFSTTIEPYYQDELGDLANGYNEMTRELQSLIDRVYISNIREKESELKALEAQINPHFLYNTLETMMTKAETQKNYEIVDMIYSLARFFRLSLNRGKDKTTVGNEKELLEHYLLLQKIRYKDKLDYRISIDEQLLGIHIPKLILQPFVENAIIHGITPKKEAGSILVSGYKEGGSIVFEITDTGVGMSEEQYRELTYNLEHNIEYETAHGGYALHNVRERLRLAFGEDGFKLDISTIPMKGSSIKITIYNIPEQAGEIQ